MERQITARERFRAIPMGRRKGNYLVFDRLRFPGFWEITIKELHKGLWGADYVVHTKGDINYGVLQSAAKDREIETVAHALEREERHHAIERGLESNTVSSNPKSTQTSQLPGRVKTLTRTAAKPKDAERKVPKYLVVNAEIAGHTVRALIDSGSLADFVSTTLVDQLGLELHELAKPIPCTMAASGSRTMIQYSSTVHFKFHQISEERTFDVMNLENWDVILGTPFMYQHAVMIGLNPPRISIGSRTSKKWMARKSQPSLRSPLTSSRVEYDN
jgi:hypothetical protein